MVNAKFWAAFAFAVLGAAMPFFTDQMDAAAWINVAIAVSGAVTVWVAPNVPEWNYVKLFASAVSAGCMVAVSLIADGLSSADMMMIAAAVLGALGVWAAPNKSQFDLAS